MYISDITNKNILLAESVNRK